MAPKTNGPLLVIIAALVVVGAGAAGWFLFNKEEPPVEPEPKATPVAKTSTTAPTLAPTNSEEHTKVTATEAPVTDKPAVREYVVDGKTIRDHRPESYPPLDLPPAVHPPDGRKIQPESTGAVSRAFKDVMRECVAQIPAAERTGEKPKMESTIAIAIKGKQAKIIKASIQLRDVSGPNTDTAKACIEQKAIGVGSAVDEEDIDSYDITTSFVF